MKAHTFVHSQKAEYYQNKMFNKINESKEIVTVSIFLKGVSDCFLRLQKFFTASKVVWYEMWYCPKGDAEDIFSGIVIFLV